MDNKTPVFVWFASGISSKKVYDIELIKQDLLNRINTRRGERLMDPEFGSIIWDLLFEHKSEFVVNEIRRDLEKLVASDSRVILQQIEILEVEDGYIGTLVLYYNRLNIQEEFTINFNKRAITASEGTN